MNSLRYQHLQQRAQNLERRLKLLETNYDLETRVEEQLRLEALIADSQKNLLDVQTQMAILRGEV
ncbi:MAG: hypothetical protein RLZZ215_2085 [Pseudomonadota bacterium]|jgi:HPt (histidine-containing phosphotransfer) domain-containing protein